MTTSSEEQEKKIQAPKRENFLYIKEKCEDLRNFLDDVEKQGTPELSDDSQQELLEIQRRLAILTVKTKAKENEQTEFREQTKEDGNEEKVTKEPKKCPQGGAIKKNKKYLKSYKLTSDNNVSFGSSSSSSSAENDSEIPKRKKKSERRKKHKLKYESQSDDSEEEHVSMKKYQKAKKSKKDRNKYISLSEDSSESDSDQRKKIKRKQGNTSSKSELTTRDYLKIMAERMDTRKVPECDKFDEESGQHLEEFLDEFEDYCIENVKGGDKYWIKELQQQLSGEVLVAFKCFKEYKYPYPKLRKKLLLWYEEMTVERK